MSESGLDLIDNAADRSSEEWSDCVDYLTKYFTVADGVPDYSGARFESFGHNPPNRIVVDDLLAVSMLGVHVPGHTALRFLERDVGAISTLLERIPDDLDLAEAESDDIADGSPAYDLWRVLHTGGKRRNVQGTGETTTSKLLARKRPRLLPVYDSVVARQFDIRNADDHWDLVHQWLTTSPTRVETLRALCAASGAPTTVSVLRTLDVVLWMHGKEDSDTKRQRDPESE